MYSARGRLAIIIINIIIIIIYHDGDVFYGVYPFRLVLGNQTGLAAEGEIFINKIFSSHRV